LNYLVQWFHAYVTHFGAWFCFVFSMTLHKKGAPDLKALPSLFKVALIVALVLSIFSSHSQTHYLSTLIK
jgi:hypothetical protein